ncbi:MAG: amidase [Acetobacteraceae bacterium]
MPEYLTIADAALLIAQRKLSPVELVEWHLDRIDRLNPRLAAFILLTRENALASARQAEAEIVAGRYRGPLHGIPIAHKDIFCTRGIATTAHSRWLLSHVPTEDATVVRRLSDAGTVMLGKLATHEFAWGGPSFDLPWPPARNPWHLDHHTGGSSSGTGAAVAAGLIMGGTGSDSGGSIRFPAAYCGIAGFKPTYGLCPRTGVFPLAPSLDHAGPMAWTVEDCAILLQAMAGYDPDDPASVRVQPVDYLRSLDEPIAGTRIGLVPSFMIPEADCGDDVLAALEGAASVFRSAGAKVREITLPPLVDWTACGMIILTVEAFAIHAHALRTRPELYGECFRDRASVGRLIDPGAYMEAQRLRRELSGVYCAALREVDLLLCPITPAEAPLIASTTKMGTFERPSFAMPFNVTGAPALGLRAGFARSGLPIGVQIAGRPFEDALVLRAGHQYERATGPTQRRPDLAWAVA